jgi:ribosomal-protein-alanine N-acetyltransferase
MKRIVIEPPARRHERLFLDAVARSRGLHRRLVFPPDTPAAFRRWVARIDGRTNLSWLIVLRDDPDGLVGAVNVSEIVRGVFRSGYLGYYALVPHQGQGLMKAGLTRVVSRAFGVHGLHRLEANIQPGNDESIGLVRGLGFRLEGVSPRYLRIGGRWRDHERWAILREEWRAPRGSTRRPGGPSSSAPGP